LKHKFLIDVDIENQSYKQTLTKWT
jgi:hypothetical protein